MDNKGKVRQLQKLIYDTLTPLITTDFVYLDVPHHFNSGDTLIWEGTMQFISKLPYKCKCVTNAFSPAAGKAVDKVRHAAKSSILLHGGGNFGDLWTLHQKFRNQVITNCGDIPVIILPQTIYYHDEDNLKKDADFFSSHPNVTLCVRDYASLDIARTYFPANNPILVPDMAFCIDFEKSGIPNPIQRTLFVLRNDKELSGSLKYDIVPTDATVSDWPTIAPGHHLQHLHTSALNWCARFDSRLGTDIRSRLEDYYWNNEIRKKIVDNAVDFIGRYRNIYTTRMHAAILSVLLNRDKIILFDNSYGKSSSFADAWFYDLDSITVYR